MDKSKRQVVIAGNWKMNKNAEETKALLAEMTSFMNEFEKLKSMLENDDKDGMREMMRRSTSRRSLFDKPIKNKIN